MSIALGLARFVYKQTIFYKGRRIKQLAVTYEPSEGSEECGDDYDYVPTTTYTMVKRKPYDIMQSNFGKTDLTNIMGLASELAVRLTHARRIDLIFEPYHVRFVGKAGQCKTQFALQLMKLFDACGLIGVSRSAADNFFDDLVKQVRMMAARKEADCYVYHPSVASRDDVDLDVLFLDEVNAKKRDDPGMQIILDGVTPLKWKPLMANPASKGKSFKPALWISTANHEITDHAYCIPAVLRRTHRRYVVEGGRLYDQQCYKIADTAANFQGGFDICAGRFGRWEETTTTVSNTRTVDSEGHANVVTNTSSSNTRVTRIEDTMKLSSFKCQHCKEFSFAEFVELTLQALIERLDSALITHQNTDAMTSAVDSSVTEA
jgi:hypothetical protein